MIITITIAIATMQIDPHRLPATVRYKIDEVKKSTYCLFYSIHLHSFAVYSHLNIEINHFNFAGNN